MWLSPGRSVKLIRRLWIALTYWAVPCEDCNGTGICATLQNGQPPSRPHSCCGDCERKKVPVAEVPPGFADALNRKYGYCIIGDGVMYHRPWSRRQVQKPR